MQKGEIRPSTTPRLYLDLDGVVYPITPLYEASVDPEDVGQLHDHEWWRKSIVQRIGKLGVEVVMSSSWGTSFMNSRNSLNSPIEDIDPKRSVTDELIFDKAVEVARDLRENPAPFIWIDDHLNQQMIDTVKAATSMPGLFVKTYKMQGLTHDELTAIEKGFLEQI